MLQPETVIASGSGGGGGSGKSTTAAPTSATAKSSSNPTKKSSSNSKSSGNSNKSSKSQHHQELYCICRSADTSQFMIACDKCDEWYHGDCVGVTQSLSKKIKAFYCHLCREKNSNLRIKYKRKFHKFLKLASKNSEKKEALMAKKKIYARFYKETRTRERKEAQLLLPPGSSTAASERSVEKHHHKTDDKKKKHQQNKRRDSDKPVTATAASDVSATDIGPIMTNPAPTSNRTTSFDALLFTTESLLSMETKTGGATSTVDETAAAGAPASDLKSQHFGKSQVSCEDFDNFFSALTKLQESQPPPFQSTIIQSTGNQNSDMATNVISSPSLTTNNNNESIATIKIESKQPHVKEKSSTKKISKKKSQSSSSKKKKSKHHRHHHHSRHHRHESDDDDDRNHRATKKQKRDGGEGSSKKRSRSSKKKLQKEKKSKEIDSNIDDSSSISSFNQLRLHSSGSNLMNEDVHDVHEQTHQQRHRKKKRKYSSTLNSAENSSDSSSSANESDDDKSVSSESSSSASSSTPSSSSLSSNKHGNASPFSSDDPEKDHNRKKHHRHPSAATMMETDRDNNETDSLSNFDKNKDYYSTDSTNDLTDYDDLDDLNDQNDSNDSDSDDDDDDASNSDSDDDSSMNDSDASGMMRSSRKSSKKHRRRDNKESRRRAKKKKKAAKLKSSSAAAKATTITTTSSSSSDKKISSQKKSLPSSSSNLKKSNSGSTNQQQIKNASSKAGVKMAKSGKKSSNKNQLQQQQSSSKSSQKNNNNNQNEKIIKEPIQCLGPGCKNAALESSKYCSDECGLMLAEKRLALFLELHLSCYLKTESQANIYNREQLSRINEEIDSLRQKLVELEMRHQELDAFIEKAKQAKIDPNVEKELEKSIEANEVEIICVTCGYSCSERQSLKHMDKCFNKIESQAFFGSFYKTHIDGQSMFCDYFNSQTKMYCKRLKVMCPEHQKEKKISDQEVCGCTLDKYENIKIVTNDVSNDFNNSISSREICLAPKRSCPLHYKWEKLKRAQIDLEKLRAWMKLEELLEKKRAHESALNQRGGLLAILLHKTETHEQPSLPQLSLQQEQEERNNI